MESLHLVLYIFVSSSGVSSEFICLDTLASLIFITRVEKRKRERKRVRERERAEHYMPALVRCQQ